MLVIGILDGFAGKPTWESLIDEVERRTAQRYTRQALHKHARIQGAFNLAKRRIQSGRSQYSESLSLEEQLMLRQQNARLKAENERLTAENNSLLERHAIWAYNAHLRGLDELALNNPLPPVNRRRSR